MVAVNSNLQPSKRDATDDVTERVGGRENCQHDSLAEIVAETPI